MPPKRDPPPLEETLAALNLQITENHSKTNATLEALPATIASAITESMSQFQKHLTQFMQNPPIPTPMIPPPYVEQPSSSSINQESSPLHPHLRPPDPYPGPATIKPPRVQLATFDGTQPLDWIFQANQFFQLYQVPESERLNWVSFYMQGDALSWYKHLYDNHLLRDWRIFLRDMEIRFGPSTFENHQATLFKLRQRGTVADFQTDFERLANCVAGLSLEALKNCFISGLRDDIQRELAVLRPRTLTEAMGQAKLVEAKIGDSRNRPLPFQNRNSQGPFLRHFPNTNSAPPTLPANPGPRPLALPAPTPRPNTTPQFKRLTPEELRYKRENGLCFGCPEKFHAGHKCKQQHHHFLLLAPTVSYPHEEVFEDALEEEQTDIAQDQEYMMTPAASQTLPTTESAPTSSLYHLSTAACFGSPSPRTLRVEGRINGQLVTVLVDSGSTHNIIQPRIVEHLRLPLQPRDSLSVMVGNGDHMQCTGECFDIPLTMAGHIFSLPLLVLPIQGADVVLGIAWLQTLGTIQADFAVPTLSFQHDGKFITLSGEPSLLPSTERQLRRLLHTEAVASMHAVWHEPSDSPSTVNFGTTSSSPMQLTSLLEQYKDLFQPPTGLPPSRTHDHHINLQPDTRPVNIRPYRYPHYQKEIMTKMIAEMLRDGIIRPSTSPYSSPVLLVRKKDGTWRFCVDYRGLNAVTIRDRFPIPTVDELLDELHGATIFSKIDLRSGYHQIRVAPEDIHKTAFRTVDGHYEFVVMPFGLTNAPSTFQAAMNDLFRSSLRRFVLVFFDDILVYSRTTDEHHDHLSQVFHTLITHTYYAKLTKCVFGVSHVNYLGHIISASGVAADPDKITAISSWPAPTTFTTLRGFLGLTGYYRRFVRQYAKVAGPLTDLLKLPKFTWTSTAQQAFQTLKDCMTSLPILALPDFTLPFEVTTDASGCAIGAVLSQNDHPIAFFSKKLSTRMQAAGAYTRELFAVTQAVQKWRQYLLGHKFYIYTDQQSLKHLLTQTIQTQEQEKWLTKLMGYTYEIRYKPGCENKVADALSRIASPSCLAVSAPAPTWLITLRQFFDSHPVGRQLLHNTTHQDNSDPSLVVHDGLIYHKHRLLIPLESGLRPSLIQEYHSSALGGHSGVKATAVRLASSFFWPTLVADVKSHVKTCITCQQTKYLTQKPFGLLQPLPIPTQVWEDLSMDFITSLPLSQGKTAIWVIVDRLTKFAHFIALPPSYTAVSLASIFLTDIYKLHGLPRTIVSDRDPIFLSKFWRELFRLLGTTLQFSSAYHPQTDGQTEVVNRCLEAYLRCFVCDEPRRWTRFLSLAEFWYNTSYHTALKMSPFQALYGRPPPPATTALPGSTTVPSIATILSDHADVLATLKQNLQSAQQRMVFQANKHRLDKQFEPGDRVFLKLRPYRQTTVRRRGCPKLSRRYYGPFSIIRRVGQVAYELDLPASAKLHRVFHVSLLRPCHGSDTVLPTPLPAMDASGRPVLRPTNFLDQRYLQRSGHIIPQVLVQWENTPSEEASWEDLDNFTTDAATPLPPSPKLADKFPAIGEGIDTEAAVGRTIHHESAEESAEHGRKVTELGVKPRNRRQPAWMADFLLSLFT